MFSSVLLSVGIASILEVGPGTYCVVEVDTCGLLHISIKRNPKHTHGYHAHTPLTTAMEGGTVSFTIYRKKP